MSAPLSVPVSLAASYERLRRSARAELPAALSALRARFPGEEFYVLAFETTPRGDSLGLVGSSEEDLAGWGEQGRWQPRGWTRRLPDLSAFTETQAALDELHHEARARRVELAALLRATWLELWSELRESGWVDPFGEPLLTVSDGSERSWREAAAALNPWLPWER